MGVRRWLTPEGLARERRQKVREWIMRMFGREITDDEITDGLLQDYRIDRALKEGRLEDLWMGADVFDDEEEIPLN